MDFPRLHVFLAVAQHLSFSRAADALHLSQPAVSKHIRLLESELGVTLFLRLGNRVELTDAGRMVQDYAQRVSVISDDLRRVLDEVRGLRRGFLRIAASTTPGLYLLPRSIALFQQTYSEIEATLTVTNSAEALQSLSRAENDAAFVGIPPADPSGLQVRPFVGDEVVLVTPVGHELATHRGFSPGLLARETLISREAGSGTRAIAEAGLARLGLQPRRVVEVQGCEAVKRMIEVGLGVGFLSRRSIEVETECKRLATCEVSELRFPRQLYLVTRKEMRPPAALLAFLALAMNRQLDTSSF